ncbi:heme ABC exporter ATP-binding protein CcmA [Acuticoccus sediminis]|uniref:heme ABC exporter ATP-binding protein CcmA n=1 Tax=Acuticoccus sediminis TaxID=2184697 RepID=UPI001CFD6893|nr:heme ABC exporter ATP-binding protein CcmA [Acuticoccus sediminis]
MLSLEVDGLDVERGGRRVLKDISLRVAGCQAMAVVGANGAGKSTLLRTVAGLIRPRSGTIRLSGVDGPPFRAMHLVAHQNAIKLPLTADQNVRFWIRTLDAPDIGDWSGNAAEAAGAVDIDASIESALDRVGLLPLIDTPAQLFSQGQRRRLALARLVAVRRPVWLLDEPTAGLDAASRAAFAALMAEHVAGGGMILAATHEPLGIDTVTLDLTSAAAPSEDAAQAVAEAE